MVEPERKNGSIQSPWFSTNVWHAFIKPDVISLLSLFAQGYPKKYGLKFLRYDNSKIKLSFFAVNPKYSIFIGLFNDLAKKTISLQLSCITNIGYNSQYKFSTVVSEVSSFN